MRRLEFGPPFRRWPRTPEVGADPEPGTRATLGLTTHHPGL